MTPYTTNLTIALNNTTATRTSDHATAEDAVRDLRHALTSYLRQVRSTSRVATFSLHAEIQTSNEKDPTP